MERFQVRLAHALRDSGEVRDEARAEGFPTPTDLAIKNANRLLKEMHPLSLHRFEVYPMPDGEIAIDASMVKEVRCCCYAIRTAVRSAWSIWQASIAGPGIPPPTPCPTVLYVKPWPNLN